MKGTRKRWKKKIGSCHWFWWFEYRTIERSHHKTQWNYRKFKAARDNANINDRIKRILSEIIRGFNLLLDHTNEEIEAPLVSVQQIQEFIAFCRDCLPKVMPDGSMNDEDLREFVVRSIRFRALLYGATPLRKIVTNVQIFINQWSQIQVSLIHYWVLNSLENRHFGILLEDEINPIFVGKKQKRKKGSKNK